MEDLKDNIKRIFNSCRSIGKSLAGKVIRGTSSFTRGLYFVLAAFISISLLTTSIIILILTSISALVIEEGAYTVREILEQKDTPDVVN